MKVAFFVEGQKSLGHMSRALELERRLLALDRSVQTVFFVNSTFTDPFEGKEIVQINIPDQGNRGGELGGDYFGVVDLVREERPDVLVFDTLYPRVVVDAFPEIPKVLVLRKYRDRELRLFLDEKRYALFDSVLIPHAPSEFLLAGEMSNAEFVEPIVRPVPKSGDRKGILVMCGGGGFGDAKELVALTKGLDATVITGPFYNGNFKGAISYDAKLPERLGNAELVISAAGYNAVNEIISGEVPSLLIPGERNNDDQEGRAAWLSDLGGAKLYDPGQSMESQVKEMLRPPVLRKMRKALRGLRRETVFRDASAIIHHKGEYRDYRLRVGKTCNNHCVFCKELDMKGEENDTLLDEVKSAKEAGYNRIVLPCNAEIRKDFKVLLRGITDLGMRMVLWTNGRMASYSDHARVIADSIHEVKVHVACEERFSEVMRTDSFEQMKKGITNLVDFGVTVTGVQTVVPGFSKVTDLGVPVEINYPVGSEVPMADTVDKVADSVSAGVLYNLHAKGLDLNEEIAEVRYVSDPELIEVVELCTLRDCNIKCSFCELSHLPKERMKTIKVKEAIDRVALYPVESLVFGGGEPTLRDDLEELVAYARGNVSSKIIISTNGVLLNKKKIERLVAAGADMFVFAVHGMGETHDHIVKTPGAWKKLEKTLKGIDGPKRSLKTVVIPENVDEIIQLVDFCAEHGLNPFILNLPHTEGPGLPVDFLDEFYYSILPQVYEKAEKLGIQVMMRPMFTELVRMPQKEIAKRLRLKGFDEEIELFSKERYGKRFYDEYPCKRKGHEYFITATGDVYRCIVSPIFDKEMGNVFKDGLGGVGEIPDDSCGKCKNYFDYNVNEEKIEVSIIVPTYERRGLLENTLKSLFRQDLSSKRYEIIVVDDGSLDGTEEMIRSLVAPCRLMYVVWPRDKPYVYGKPGNRAGPARNIGVRYARGEKILFWDSDMIAAPDMLSKHLQEYEDGVCSLGVRKYLREGIKGVYPFSESDIGPDIRVSKMLRDRDYDVMNYTAPYFFWTSNNVMVSREALMRVGGFDKNFVYWGTEDQELGYRLMKDGFSLKVVQDAIGYHQWHREESVDDETFMKITGIQKELFYKKHLTRDLYDFHAHIFEGRAAPFHQSVTLNLTNRCNLRCGMCFDHGTQDEVKELSIENIRKVVKELHFLGYESFNLSGGEPTVHPQFKEIVELFVRYHISYSLSTNGTFDDGIFKILKTYSPERIIFSLDGDRETHDMIRGKGTFDKCVANIKKCLDAGMSVLVQTVFHSKNFRNIPDLIGFTKKMGVRGHLIQAYHSDGKAEYWFQEKDLGEMDTVIDSLITKKEGFLQNTETYLERLKQYFRGSDLAELEMVCTANRRFGINYDGEVMPCWGKKWDLGNVGTKPIGTILSSKELRVERQKMRSCTTPCLLMCYDHSRK